MEDRFEAMTRQLLHVMLQVNLEEAPELEAETLRWMERAPGPAEIDELVEWSVSNDAFIAPYLDDIQTFVRNRTWGPARAFIDAYGIEQLNAAIVVQLLRWMRDLPSHRELLAESPMISDPATRRKIGSLTVSSVRTNERIQGDPDYVWYWRTYLTALDEADLDATDVPFADDLRWLVWRSGEVAELGYALGRLQGRLEQQERGGDELRFESINLLADLRRSSAETNQMMRLQLERQEAASTVLHEVRGLLEQIRSDLPDLAELTAEQLREFLFEAVAERKWERTKDELLRRSATNAAREHLERRFGGKWESLLAASRDDLVAVELLRPQENLELAPLVVLGLSRAVERELRGVLTKLGATELKEMGDLISRAGASGGELALLSTDLRSGVLEIRNRAAHGDLIELDETLRFEQLVTGLGAGLLWRVVGTAT